MNTGQWYYQMMGEVVGPLSAAELRQHAADGQIERDTLIRKGSDGRWVLADKVRGLLDTANQPTAKSSRPFVPPWLAAQPVVTSGTVIPSDPRSIHSLADDATEPASRRMRPSAVVWAFVCLNLTALGALAIYLGRGRPEATKTVIVVQHDPAPIVEQSKPRAVVVQQPKPLLAEQPKPVVVQQPKRVEQPAPSEQPKAAPVQSKLELAEEMYNKITSFKLTSTTQPADLNKLLGEGHGRGDIFEDEVVLNWGVFDSPNDTVGKTLVFQARWYIKHRRPPELELYKYEIHRPVAAGGSLVGFTPTTLMVLDDENDEFIAAPDDMKEYLKTAGYGDRLVRVALRWSARLKK